MERWFLIAGALFLLMGIGGSFLQRLPLTTAILYLAAGVMLGPPFADLLRLDPIRDATLLERVTEIAVLISLFTAGLKLRLPLSHREWRLPVRLATASMALTVGLVAVVGVVTLGLPLGAAVLLGGILAPTDPVLASDVQVTHALDRDRVRFSLTGEAGLNDGTAFPFVFLGLGLLGLHDLGALGWRWLVFDVVWAVSAGLGVGWALGVLVGHLALRVRRQRAGSVGLDDFLGLGVICLAYGAALLLEAYGFLAVFAAGLALRSIERRTEACEPAADGTPGECAPAYMLRGLIGFNERLERVSEVAVVVLLGAILAQQVLAWEAIGFALLLVLVLRPLSVGVLRAPASLEQRAMIAWFGVRGIGSLYYLSFAIGHGVPVELAQRLTSLTLAVVALSIGLHGLSVTPLMTAYGRRTRAMPPA